MRVLFGVVTALLVMGLGYWAYMENFRTHDTLREMNRVTAEISVLNEALIMLRAEWAFLNRPDRLRDLAEMNHIQLGLEPLSATAFGGIEQVSFPPQPAPLPVPEAPMDLLPSATGPVAEGVLTVAVPSREEISQ